VNIACVGAAEAARAVLPGMIARARGTIIFTGATAAMRGSSGFAAYAPAKFAARGLAQSLAREFGPKGIHVAHVVIDGLINTPKIREWMPQRDATTMLDTDAIAEVYWQLHVQHASTWTHELDIRPHTESF